MKDSFGLAIILNTFKTLKYCGVWNQFGSFCLHHTGENVSDGIQIEIRLTGVGMFLSCIHVESFS